MTSLVIRVVDEGPRRFDVIGSVDGVEVGHVTARRERRSGRPENWFRVISSHVDETLRRQGVATRLYRTAAKEACRRGHRLRSFGFDRSSAADGLWLSLVASGEARDARRLQGTLSHRPDYEFPCVRRNGDDWLYSVTYYGRLESIAEHGLVPNAPEGVGRGGNRSHSEGRVFLTHCDGVFFWYSRYQDHADDRSDDVLEDGMVPVVLRLPRKDVPHELHEDPHGRRDALHPAWFVEGEIPPDVIDVWTGAKWVSVSDWSEIDPGLAVDSEEDPDEPGEELHWWKQSEPLRPRCGTEIGVP